jgi:hypothetical protein
VTGGREEDWARFLLLFLVLEACEQVRSQTASSSSSSFAFLLGSILRCLLRVCGRFHWGLEKRFSSFLLKEEGLETLGYCCPEITENRSTTLFALVLCFQ